MLRSLLLLALLALARPGFATETAAADPFNDAPTETGTADPFNHDPAETGTAESFNQAPTETGTDDFQAREDPGVVVLDDPDTGGPTPADQVPIDGGLAWLAAAGAGYAVQNLRKRRAWKAEKGGAAQ